MCLCEFVSFNVNGYVCVYVSVFMSMCYACGVVYACVHVKAYVWVCARVFTSVYEGARAHLWTAILRLLVKPVK